MHGGQHADPQVDGIARHGEFDSAVLRQASLGDVQIGHDFDARGQRRSDVLAGRDHFIQHAVNTIAHLEFVFKRFEVDVRRLILDRLEKYQVQQPDDRCGVHHFPQIVEIDGGAAALERLKSVVGRQFFDQAGDRLGRILGIITIQRPLDMFAVTDLGDNVHPQQGLQVVGRLKIVGAGNRDGHGVGAGVVLNRYDFVGVGHLRRDQRDGLRFYVDPREIDGLHAHLRRQGQMQVFLGDVTQLDQDLPDRTSVFPLDIQGFGDLSAVDPPHLDEDAAELSPFELLDRWYVQRICHCVRFPGPTIFKSSVA